MSQSPPRRHCPPAEAGGGGRSPLGGPLGERLERLAERFGSPDDVDADLLAARTAEAWAEVQAGLHAPVIVDGAAPAAARAPEVPVEQRRVPVPEAVMALGWSHVVAWVCFSAMTRARGSTVSAGEVAEVAGWSAGHTRRLLAAIAGLGDGLVVRERRRWAPGCLWRDITGYRDRDGRWRKPAHGRFQHHSISELADLDRTGRRRVSLLAALRLWCRQRRVDGSAFPVFRRVLARWCGCSRRTIDRTLAALAEAGAVTVAGGPGGLSLEVLDTT